MRKTNLDLLRIISMFMVVVLHTLSHGGILANNKDNTILLGILYFIKILSVIAVNLFVLINSYLMTNRKSNYISIIKIIIQTLFYSTAIFLILHLFNFRSLDIKEIPFFFFPIMSKTYWFITTYIGLYLLIPYFNILIDNINKRTHLTMLILMTVLFSLMPSIFFFVDIFNLSNGFSLLWFIYLFFVGSYIRKYYKLKNNISERIKYVTVYLLMSILLLLSVFVMSFISDKYLGELASADIFITYNSILVLISSISFFIIFLNIEIKNNIINKIILFISPNVLAVYILHDNRFLRPLMWEWFNFSKYNNYIIILMLILSATFIFIVTISIELLRRLIFRKFYKLNFWVKLEEIINNKMQIEEKGE